MAKTGKISDHVFWSILRECSGIYALTAKAISRKYKIAYSRQAVRQRAEENLELLNDIREAKVDLAEEGLVALMESPDEDIKFRACKEVARTLGKSRGFSEKLEIEGNIIDPISKIIITNCGANAENREHKDITGTIKLEGQENNS